MNRIFLATSCWFLSTFSCVRGASCYTLKLVPYKDKSYPYFLNNGRSCKVDVIDLNASSVHIGKNEYTFQVMFSVLADPEKLFDILSSKNGSYFLQFYDAVANNRYGPGRKDIADPSQNPPDKKDKCIRPFYHSGKTYYVRLHKLQSASLAKLNEYASDIKDMIAEHSDKESRKISLKEWYIEQINKNNSMGLFLNSVLAKNENVHFLKNDDSLAENNARIEFCLTLKDPFENKIIVVKYCNLPSSQTKGKKRIQHVSRNDDDSQAPEEAPKVSIHKDIKKKSTKVKTEKKVTSGGEPTSERSRKTKIFKDVKCQAKAPVSLMYGVSRNEEGVIELEKGVEWTPYLAKLTYLTLQKVVQQDPSLNAQKAEKKLTELIKDNPIESFADQKLCNWLSIENRQIKMKAPSKSDKEIFLGKRLICLVLSSNPPQELKASCQKILDDLNSDDVSRRQSKGTQATSTQLSPDIFSLTATDKTGRIPWESVIYLDMARAQKREDYDGFSRLLATIPLDAIFAERFTDRSTKDDKKTRTSLSQISLSESSDSEWKHKNTANLFEEEEEEVDLEGSL